MFNSHYSPHGARNAAQADSDRVLADHQSHAPNDVVFLSDSNGTAGARAWRAAHFLPMVDRAWRDVIEVSSVALFVSGDCGFHVPDGSFSTGPIPNDHTEPEDWLGDAI